VRIEPQENLTVDVFLTHTCANDENSWCRDAQIRQLVTAVGKSAADFVILGGDFNLDPRANETGYHTLKEELVRYCWWYFISSMLSDPDLHCRDAPDIRLAGYPAG
jgi:hypothetical protein